MPLSHSATIPLRIVGQWAVPAEQTQKEAHEWRSSEGVARVR